MGLGGGGFVTGPGRQKTGATCPSRMRRCAARARRTFALAIVPRRRADWFRCRIAQLDPSPPSCIERGLGLGRDGPGFVLSDHGYYRSSTRRRCEPRQRRLVPSRFRPRLVLAFRWPSWPKSAWRRGRSRLTGSELNDWSSSKRMCAAETSAALPVRFSKPQGAG